MQRLEEDPSHRRHSLQAPRPLRSEAAEEWQNKRKSVPHHRSEDSPHWGDRRSGAAKRSSDLEGNQDPRKRLTAFQVSPPLHRSPGQGGGAVAWLASSDGAGMQGHVGHGSDPLCPVVITG